MTTLTKLLEPRARPAQVLLNRAKQIPLTSAQRAVLPDHIDAGDAHLHHSVTGHRLIEVGDVLLDQGGGFWVVSAAPETLWRVTGDTVALVQAAYQLGGTHRRLAVHATGFDVLPDAKLHAQLGGLGLTITPEFGVFAPEPEVKHGHADEHDHAHDHDHGHVHGPNCGHEHHHHR
jgi:urease accessory protein UreE